MRRTGSWEWGMCPSKFFRPNFLRRWKNNTDSGIYIAISINSSTVTEHSNCWVVDSVRSRPTSMKSSQDVNLGKTFIQWTMQLCISERERETERESESTNVS